MKEPTGWWHDLVLLVQIYLPLMLPSFLARFIWHSDQARAGKRPWFSIALVATEGAIVVLSAVVGAGIAEFYELGPRATAALTGLCAWFGPSGLQALILLWIQRKAKS